MHSGRIETQKPSMQALPASNPPPLPENGPLTDSQAECERLRELMRCLQVERQHDRETLAAVQKECAQYRQALYAWAGQQFTEEELTKVPEEKECLPLEQFIEDLEKIARGS